MTRRVWLTSFRLTVVLMFGLVGAFALFGSVQPAAATHVEPVTVSGNPTCAQLAPVGENWTELKVDPGRSGTFTQGPLTVTVTVRGTPLGDVFDWTSNIPLDAVFSKGGPEGGNLYVYNPEATADTGLHSPQSGGSSYAGLSHISFCYDLELQISKTANTTFTRTFEWDIDKSVAPAEWNLFNGDSGTSNYTVTVTKSAPIDSGWAVSGVITIVNPAGTAATITNVTDVISDGINATVNCGAAFPIALAPGATKTCSYSAALPDGTSRVNTATVTSTGVLGGTATAPVTFGAPTTLVNDTINVADSVEGSLGFFSNSGSTSYTRTFTCGNDAGVHDNIATIVETGQSDDASVTVNCYALAVTKDALTTHNRTVTYDWAIDKVVDAPALELEIGASFTVNYDVVVNASVFSDVSGGHAVSGNIRIANPAPIAADLVSVTDLVSPDIAATVNCPSSTVPAFGALVCSYSSALPDAAPRLNTATATQQNYAYGPLGFATATGTTQYSGSADVIFGDPITNYIDECADISDSYAGFLGNLCANQAPYTFEYSRQVGGYAECGTFRVDNTATVVAVDTGTQDSDDAAVVITVPCRPQNAGCTPGFWKNNLEHHNASQFIYGFASTDLVPGTTLTFAEALNKTGRQIYYAHLAAAYLNWAALGDDYGLSYDEIATASKDQLEAANEAGCPLDQHG